MWLLTILLLLAIAALFYLFLIWNFDYWQKRGVRGPKPLPFLGNYPNAISQKQHIANDLDDVYRKFKNDEDFVGIYRCKSPQLLVLSPTLIRRILVTDFKHFHDNEVSEMVDNNSDFIFANNPFTLTGEEWKERRARVTPALTMGRIKNVYPVTQKICKKMTDYIKTQLRTPPKQGIDAKDIALRFTTEVVTDCVLGLNAESFSEHPTPILSTTQKLFGQSLVFIFYTVVIGLLPALKTVYKTRFIPRDIEKFFVNLMQTAIDARKSRPEQHAERADFLQFLLQLQEKKSMSTLDLTAHTMTFLLDGFETSASVLSHCLLLLGRDQTAQEKLRKEIVSHLNEKGEMEFDTLAELPYLNACIHETIRIFPPGFFSNRLCTEPIELTNKNGHSVRLEKGDVVALPFFSVMRDNDYYPNAEEFQPERFLEEPDALKKYREKGLYYGFGDGPRVCIGMRFALIQVKAALVELLTKFNIRVNPKTRKDNRLDPVYFLTQLDGGIWLDLEARD